MPFTNPRGTRGVRQPPKALLRWGNRMMAKRAGRPGASFMGMDVLVLHTVGRRSGQPRAHPVARFPGPGGSWHVVASAGGAARNPDWYLNLAAHPDQASVEIGGRTIPVTAEELQGAERAEAWAAIVAAAPRFGDYETRTDREIPVIRLTPRA